MSTFRITYRIKGYRLSDAFRPDPRWGKRIFTADSENLGTEDVGAVKVAAIETAPEGYDFFRIEKIGGSTMKENSNA